MSWPPIPSAGKTVRTAWVTAMGGSAGVLAHLAAASKSTVTVVVLVTLVIASPIVISLPKIVESIYKRRPAIIREKGIARVLRSDAATRRKLALAGLDPEKTEQAERMLRLHAITPALPKDQRLSTVSCSSPIGREVSTGSRPPSRGAVFFFPFSGTPTKGAHPTTDLLDNLLPA